MSLVKENKNNSSGVKTEKEIYKRMSPICRIFGHVYGCMCVCMCSAELMFIMIKIKAAENVYAS